jgi:hypothetical protein
VNVRLKPDTTYYTEVETAQPFSMRRVEGVCTDFAWLERAEQEELSMRFVLTIGAVLVLALGASTLPESTAISSAGAGSVVSAQQPQPPSVPETKVDINVDRGASVWWASPIWIAIGAIAVVLVVLLVAMIVRGGGTTVIKE